LKQKVNTAPKGSVVEKRLRTTCVKLSFDWDKMFVVTNSFAPFPFVTKRNKRHYPFSRSGRDAICERPLWHLFHNYTSK